MKNKNLLIGVAVAVIVIIGAIIFIKLEVKKGNDASENMYYGAGIFVDLYKYDKNIEIGDLKYKEEGDNYYVVTVTAGDDYTKSTYGEEIVKMTINKSTGERVKIYGDNTKLNNFLLNLSKE